jgi:hypothetical protein
MGLKDKLENQGSQLSELDGQTPVIPNFQQSTLHRDYSFEGVPEAGQVKPKNGVLPQPSTLDRTSINRYLDNLPS